ncbi:hypothetical protein [Methylobacterium sp. WL8]|uniref:hypothetical protein n=1 Tax=Methylobacterium sp. WL8 TaxID=2603899 RepID=UPI0011C90CA4|nr:hypothetical protein [Methylobacterium sp. WL8]TXN79292.1 hypothetical protein FV234_21030 [Methylobacterium sp. WL8]
MGCLHFAIGLFTLTCTDPHVAVPAARFCNVASIIRYSRHDTPETIRQARVANAKFHAACPGR